jgi:superfamily II DNA helicase RecQ
MLSNFTKENTAIVLSPLIAIMKDQYEIFILFGPCLLLVTIQAKKFNSQGILTAIVTSESDDEDVKRGIHGGKYSVVFFTPEIL